MTAHVAVFWWRVTPIGTLRLKGTAFWLYTHFLNFTLHVCVVSQGSGTPGAPELDPAEKDGAVDEEDDQSEKDKEEDGDGEEEMRKPHEEEEPPAFGVQGDGGDSSVIEAAKEEVRISALSEFVATVPVHTTP